VDPEQVKARMHSVEKKLLKLKMKHQTLKLKLNLLDQGNTQVDDCSSVSSFRSYKTVESNCTSRQGFYKQKDHKNKHMGEVIMEEDGSEDDGVMLTQPNMFVNFQSTFKKDNDEVSCLSDVDDCISMRSDGLESTVKLLQ